MKILRKACASGVARFTMDDVPSLSLAFLGDAVYAVYIRTFLIKEKPYLKPEQLHREANKLVSARAQSEALLYLKNEGILSPDEWDIAKKARNKSSATRAKNATIKEYRNASGIEALIGWLELHDAQDRIDVLMEKIIERGRDDDE
ncbi:ribonuclease-3 family protein [Salinicoccus halodurans]|uniref:Mini-ribonuclease 3 n=2 Tax=Salinicoccus halodurans TaxID=407035 RepID=A0AA94HDN9_9STAP|nr:ribonuclease-3 family protein [Salinicoccus halodurans]